MGVHGAGVSSVGGGRWGGQLAGGPGWVLEQEDLAFGGAAAPQPKLTVGLATGWWAAVREQVGLGPGPGAG